MLLLAIPPDPFRFEAPLGPSHLTSFRFEELTFVVLVRPPESDNERPWAHRR